VAIGVAVSRHLQLPTPDIQRLRLIGIPATDGDLPLMR
jgi:hypothetical protein